MVKKMPGYDGTGPRGRGPMTGRGLGYCVKDENGNAKHLPSPLENLTELRKEHSKLENLIRNEKANENQKELYNEIEMVLEYFNKRNPVKEDVQEPRVYGRGFGRGYGFGRQTETNPRGLKRPRDGRGNYYRN